MKLLAVIEGLIAAGLHDISSRPQAGVSLSRLFPGLLTKGVTLTRRERQRRAKIERRHRRKAHEKNSV